MMEEDSEVVSVSVAPEAANKGAKKSKSHNPYAAVT